MDAKPEEEGRNMKIETSRFGTIEVAESELIKFPWGIPGFEELKSYVLLEYRDGHFQWLQSVEEPTIAFVVCPPQFIGTEYQVPETKLEPIKVTNQNDLVVLNLVSFNSENKAVQFHMRSPLLFNIVERIGYQWTMEQDEVDKFLIIPPGLSWEEA